jgi:hypothetical protein
MDSQVKVGRRRFLRGAGAVAAATPVALAVTGGTAAAQKATKEPYLTQTAADGRYAQLAAPNTFSTGPQRFHASATTVPLQVGTVMNGAFQSLVELRTQKTLNSSGSEVGRGAIRLIDGIGNRTAELGYYEYGTGFFFDGMFEFMTNGNISIKDLNDGYGGLLELRGGVGGDAEAALYLKGGLSRVIGSEHNRINFGFGQPSRYTDPTTRMTLDNTGLLRLVGGTGKSDDFLTIVDGAGATPLRVLSTGRVLAMSGVVFGTGGVAEGDLDNGSGAWTVDEVANTATLTVKYADGTVKTASLPLE